MTDGRLATIFFEIGLVLTLISMVLGPFGISEWAIAGAIIACFLALAGMYLAFYRWNEPDEPEPGSPEAGPAPEQPETPKQP